MIPRYSRPEISKIWDQKNKFNIWLEIECHACDAMAELVATGGVPISDMGKSMMLLNPRLGEMA